MTTWQSALLVYADIDVRLPGKRRFRNQLSEIEIEEAVESFACFPALVEDLTEGRAGIEYQIVRSERPLTTLTSFAEKMWWPSPDDTRAELDAHAARCDSVFVLWPQNNFQKGTSIESGGWGLGMGASPWSGGATYATVANTASWVWRIPLKGEVWLHEWLHGVCWHFSQLGHRMPDGDADGGGRHDYTQSPDTGWTGYYRDLMNGRVLDQGEMTGIPTSAWSEPLPNRSEI